MFNNRFIVAFGNIVLIVCVFSCSLKKSGTQEKKTNIASEKSDLLYQEIKRVGLEFTKKANVPGVAVAVIQNGKVAWIQCIGYANVAEKKPVTTNTIFNVGSISKVLSAWGFMQLTEKAIINLDSPVNPFLTRWKLPDTSYDVSKVTLRRILSHTAGLSVHGYGGFEQGTKLMTLEESLEGKTKRNGERVRLINEPGTKWEYSGGGYTIAQLLLEENTKEHFASYMKNHVFKPLKLLHTDYEWTKEMLVNSATAYDTLGNPIKNRIFTEQAAAGLQTTISDLAHFAELSITKNTHQLNNVLSRETIQLMEQPVLPSSSEGESGLGYRFMNYDGFRTIGHTGENVGWNAAMFIHLPTKNGIIILCNGSNGDRVWVQIYLSWLKSVKAKISN